VALPESYIVSRKVRKVGYKPTGQTVYLLTLPIDYGEYLAGKGIDGVSVFVGRWGGLFVFPLVKPAKLKKIEKVLMKVDKILYDLMARD